MVICGRCFSDSTIAAGIVPEKGIDGKDMCICVGNLIDNAVDACLKLPENQQKTITFTSTLRNGGLLLSIRNPADGKAIKNQEMFLKQQKKI